MGNVKCVKGKPRSWFAGFWGLWRSEGLPRGLALVLACPAAVLASATAARAGEKSAAGAPELEFRAEPEVSAGAGAVAGINNTNDYLKLPIVLAAHWPAGRFEAPAAGPVEVSATVGALHELVLSGVETRHTAFQIGPRFRLGKEGDVVRVVADIRGGAGVTDSDDTPGGQGQDFCFNVWVFTGVEIRPRVWGERAALWIGALYTHVSNAGLSEPEHPNEGLDSAGVAAGGIWRF